MKKTLQKTLLALSVMVSSLTGVLTPAQALVSDNYLPMLREDRVWEYCGNALDYDGRAYHYMKFGESLTLNSRTYQRFYQFKTVIVNQDNNEVILETADDPVSYYLREENRQVFALASGDRIVDSSLTETSVAENPDGFSEIMIYDFSLENQALWDYPEYLGATGYTDPEIQLKVNYQSPVTIGDCQCIVMGFDNVEDIEFIEGIGTTRNGTLGAPNIGAISGVVDNSFTAGIQSWLNRVLDAEGEVIYHAPAGVAPPAAIQEITVGSSDSGNSSTHTIYDLSGRKVSSPLPGTIYIQEGKKYIQEK